MKTVHRCGYIRFKPDIQDDEAIWLMFPLRNAAGTLPYIRKALGLKDRSHIHKSFLQPALVAGYIEMTLSEKPNSCLQKYRFIDAGRAWLAIVGEGTKKHST